MSDFDENRGAAMACAPSDYDSNESPDFQGYLSGGDDAYFAYDEAYFAYDEEPKPMWQMPQPVNFTKPLRGGDAETAELRAMYRETAILDASSSSDKNPNIRLLQIQPDVTGRPIHCTLVKRPLWDAGEYYALSYSWGERLRDSKISIAGRRLPEHSFNVSSYLWDALNRLRGEERVTNVWVDAICINQQNDVERCAQIQVMAQIFNQAREVRIWLGERSDPEQESAIDLTLFLSLCQQPWPWWTRLWIVQECAYAEKCPVIMVGSSLISYEELIERWDAVVQMAYGSKISEHHEILKSNFQLFKTPFEIWKKQHDNSQHRSPLAQRLREMAGRQCTEPHDRIYALLSLVDEHEEKQLRPDYRKPFPELLLEVSQVMRKSASWNELRERNIFSLFDVQPFVVAALSNNCTPQDYGNALRDAIHEQNSRFARILVCKCKDSARGRDQIGNMLVAASSKGDGGVVKMLLDAVADKKTRGGHFSNALRAASSGGHEKVVQMLLDAGANVNAQGGEYGNALQAALVQGDKKVVQMLLDAGADINAQGGHYCNALQAALVQGDEKVVQILLDAGADVNAQGGYYGNALQAALVQGDEKVVQMLLDAGANVNAQGGHYSNALHAALSRGYEKVVQMLLDIGADVNAQGGEYGNALQTASVQGDEKVVQMLLNIGADVNAQGGHYGNALQAASLNGNEKVVQILLDSGADVNAQGGYYGNALQAALVQGDEKVVQMLLDAGANVNAQGGEYGNALQAALVQGDKKVVQMLLDIGADVNAQGGRFGNALQAAFIWRPREGGADAATG